MKNYLSILFFSLFLMLANFLPVTANSTELNVVFTGDTHGYMMDMRVLQGGLRRENMRSTE